MARLRLGICADPGGLTDECTSQYFLLTYSSILFAVPLVIIEPQHGLLRRA